MQRSHKQSLYSPVRARSSLPASSGGAFSSKGHRTGLQKAMTSQPRSLPNVTSARSGSRPTMLSALLIVGPWIRCDGSSTGASVAFLPQTQGPSLGMRKPHKSRLRGILQSGWPVLLTPQAHRQQGEAEALHGQEQPKIPPDSIMSHPACCIEAQPPV